MPTTDPANVTPSQPTTRASTQAAETVNNEQNSFQADVNSADEVAAPVVEIEHTPIFHTDHNLPAPSGFIPKNIHRTSLASQRKQAQEFYSFLRQNDTPVLQLNEGTTVYVALINVPKTKKVKVVFCPGVGSSPIGVTSSIVAKVLLLHGDGNSKISPPQPLACHQSMIVANDVATMVA